MSLPFALRRPFLLTRDLLQSRAHPDVEELHRVGDPEEFLWRILPHAARTFAACIAMLPAEFARAAAVAYLYCRILDTYEDLIPEPALRETALAEFGRRFGVPDGAAPLAAPQLEAARAREPRDRAHVLLVQRCHQLDAVFATLTPHVRRDIVQLVEAMSAGMIWSSRTFAQQSGVLRDAAQLSRYCQNVIGQPFLFSVRLLLERKTGDDTVSDALRQDVLVAGEMVQLANVTRDIEKDLARGVAYHPALAGDLGRTDREEPALAARIRAVREDLLLRALALAPAYERMMAALPFRTFSLARASGVLMLLFTDRYYRSCATRVGRRAWPGPTSTLTLMALTFAHFASPAWSWATVRKIRERFVRHATRGQGRGSASAAEAALTSLQ